MTANIMISCAAGSRQNERVKHIPSNSKLDEYYPDPVMDRIYGNKIVTVKRKMPKQELKVQF